MRLILMNIHHQMQYKTKKAQQILGIKRARDGTRTRDPDLGKVVLHQLSHSRIINILNLNRGDRIRTCDPLVPNQVL